MKIIIIGDYTGKGDEGLSQISQKISGLLERENKVKRINTIDVLKPRSIFEIIKYHSDIIHYITGPTLRSFVILAILKILLLCKPKIIISATRPFIPQKYFFLLKYSPVDLIFTQAGKWEEVFKKNKIATKFLPNPVNIEKFVKSGLEKPELRKKYNLPADKKILLHVGHIRSNRNLHFFLNIADKVEQLGYKIVIVSSTYFNQDSQLYSKLINAGIIVKNEYFEKIEEIYSLADLYVFPIKGLEKNDYPSNLEEVGVIDMPLSILEAISVGLTIISTEIDAVQTLLEKNNVEKEIVFWDGTEEQFMIRLAQCDGKNNNNSSMREIINQENVASIIQSQYRKLLSAGV